MENIKLVTTKARRNYLVSKLSYHSTHFFSDDLSAIEVKRKQTLVNKSAYLVLSTLEISKIVIYEFWYDYVKPKYREKTR